VTGRSPKPKTILELASGWKKNHEFEKLAKTWGFVRWELHKDALFELMEMTGIVKSLVAEIFILQRQINIQRFDHRHCCL